MGDKLDITPELALSAARVLQNWCDCHSCIQCPLHNEKCMAKGIKPPYAWKLPKEREA